MKMVFSPHRRETLSFLITTVATVTSPVNQQYTYKSGDPREARSAARAEPRCEGNVVIYPSEKI